jgi:hypothetical protein
MKKSIKIKKEFLIIGLGLLGLSFLSNFFMSDPATLTRGELFQQGVIGILCGSGGLLGAAILALGAILAIRQRDTNPVIQCLDCGAIAPSAEDQYCRTCGASLIK